MDKWQRQEQINKAAVEVIKSIAKEKIGNIFNFVGLDYDETKKDIAEVVVDILNNPQIPPQHIPKSWYCAENCGTLCDYGKVCSKCGKARDLRKGVIIGSGTSIGIAEIANAEEGS